MTFNLTNQVTARFKISLVPRPFLCGRGERGERRKGLGTKLVQDLIGQIQNHCLLHVIKKKWHFWYYAKHVSPNT